MEKASLKARPTHSGAKPMKGPQNPLPEAKVRTAVTDLIRMKILGFLLALVSVQTAALAECLGPEVAKHLRTVEKLENLVEVAFADHTLVYSKDSCGARGCELRVFTRTTPFCTQETLTTTGLYVDGSLTSKKIEVRSKGTVKRFQYYPSETRFK